MFRIFILLPVLLYILEYAVQAVGRTVVDTEFIQVYLVGALAVYVVRHGSGIILTFKNYAFWHYLILFLLVYTFSFFYQINLFPSPFEFHTLSKVYGTTALWVLIFFVFAHAVQTNILTQKELKTYVFVLYITCCLTIFVEAFFGFQGGEDELATNSGYIALMVLPLMIYYYPQRIFYIILATTIVSLVSGKRGASVGAAVVFVYYFVYYRGRFNFRVKRISFSGIIAFLVVIALGIFFFEEAYESIYFRFAEFFSEEGSGSGRFIYWPMLLNDWYEAGTLNHLFGFGIYETTKTLEVLYGKPLPAHNDYIEVLYCFGVLGLVLFVSFQYTLWTAIRRRAFSKRIKFCTDVAFITFGAYSCASGVLYRPLSMILLLSIGCLIGIENRHQINFLKQKRKRHKSSVREVREVQEV